MLNQRKPRKLPAIRYLHGSTYTSSSEELRFIPNATPMRPARHAENIPISSWRLRRNIMFLWLSRLMRMMLSDWSMSSRSFWTSLNRFSVYGGRGVIFVWWKCSYCIIIEHHTKLKRRKFSCTIGSTSLSWVVRIFKTLNGTCSSYENLHQWKLPAIRYHTAYMVRPIIF